MHGGDAQVAVENLGLHDLAEDAQQVGKDGFCEFGVDLQEFVEGLQGGFTRLLVVFYGLDALCEEDGEHPLELPD